MREAVLSGVGDTRVGRLPETSVLALHAEAALGAIADAGLEVGDIDGLLCGYSLAEPHPMLSSVFAEYLGIRPRFATALQSGGATAATAVMLAQSLVTVGHLRHVLIVLADRRLTGMPPGGAVAALAGFGHPRYEQPYGLTVPAAYALVARRYMHEYGTSAEELAAVAVTHRRHAARHPGAHMTQPLTLEEAAGSRVIASPLRLYDCCPISDGGGAVVVSAGGAVADSGRPAVAILGAGQKHTHEHILQAPAVHELGCHESAATAFAQAGVGPREIDVCEVYDSFTITLVVELESMGFFERGEAGRAALDGALELDGDLPTNTHGGLLSFGHPGAAGGLYHVIEAVRQLRGEAQQRQVQGATTAFVHGDGGILSAHCSLVLGRR